MRCEACGHPVEWHGKVCHGCSADVGILDCPIPCPNPHDDVLPMGHPEGHPHVAGVKDPPVFLHCDCDGTSGPRVLSHWTRKHDFQPIPGQLPFLKRCSMCGWGWKVDADNDFPCPGPQARRNAG